MGYFVYILENRDKGRYYIGQTTDIVRRLEEHNRGYSEFTAKYKNWQLVYKKKFNSRREALKFEKFIKRQKSHSFIDKLIMGKIIIPR